MESTRKNKLGFAIAIGLVASLPFIPHHPLATTHPKDRSPQETGQGVAESRQ